MSTVHDPGDIARFIALSDERDQFERVCLARERAAYLHGQAAGIEIGRRLEAAERHAGWVRIASPIARGGPAYAELERRRYGPGGREHFGDPRPGDFRGTGDIARPAPPRRAWLFRRDAA